MTDALRALGALSQGTRLAAFRLLVQAGPDGLPAGAIAEKLKAPAATMSFHLGQLTRAELISARRESRSIIYFARFERMRGLLEFLTEDCCGGHPEICRPTTLGGVPPDRIEAEEREPESVG